MNWILIALLSTLAAPNRDAAPIEALTPPAPSMSCMVNLNGTLTPAGVLSATLTTTSCAPWGSTSMVFNPQIPTLGFGTISGSVMTPGGPSTFFAGRWSGTLANGKLVAIALVPGGRWYAEGKWYPDGTVVGGWRL